MSVFKRVIIRIITANTNLNHELQAYLDRPDLWKENLIEYLDLVDIGKNILLRHTYIILKGIETKLAITNKVNTDSKTNNEPKTLRDWCQTKNEKINPTTTTMASSTNVTKKKGRVD
jgi:hypothetical protein